MVQDLKVGAWSSHVCRSWRRVLPATHDNQCNSWKMCMIFRAGSRSGPTWQLHHSLVFCVACMLQEGAFNCVSTRVKQSFLQRDVSQPDIIQGLVPCSVMSCSLATCRVRWHAVWCHAAWQHAGFGGMQGPVWIAHAAWQQPCLSLRGLPLMSNHAQRPSLAPRLWVSMSLTRGPACAPLTLFPWSETSWRAIYFRLRYRAPCAYPVSAGLYSLWKDIGFDTTIQPWGHCSLCTPSKTRCVRWWAHDHCIRLALQQV